MSLTSEGYYWPWLALAALGAYHGLNPAMGWLFAVALGLQERRLGAVLRAFPPIALGHFFAISAAVNASSDKADHRPNCLAAPCVTYWNFSARTERSPCPAFLCSV